jgi:hypothetical protein
MHSARVFRLGAFLLLATVPWMTTPGFADMYLDSDCHALKLKGATGVPQDKIHTYDFSGTCNINVVKSSGPVVLKTVPAVASATWNGSKHEFTETFHVLANVHVAGSISEGNTTYNAAADVTAGEVISSFRCDDDPLLSSKAACLVASHSNLSGFSPFSNPAKKQSRPLLKGKTTLAEASALSKQGGPQLHKIPLEALAQGKSNPPARMLVEAESLLASRKYLVNGGKIAVQEMTAFGPGWGGGRQLFWSGGSPGAVLDLVVDVATPGRYEVTLFLTRAPDYGNVQVEVDGKRSPASFDGYARRVVQSGAVRAGMFQLPQGPRKISLMIIGKSPQSTNYYVGIDRIVLTQSTAP